MSDNNVIVVCDEPHVFTPGVCLACERDILRAAIVSIKELARHTRYTRYDVTDICDKALGVPRE